jgi:PAS domain S-box-containing protein
VIASAINREQAQTLTYTASDEQSAGYQRFCSQLRSFCALSRFYDICFVCRRNGRLVRGPSCSAGHEADAHAPPGAPIEHPPPELTDAFDNKQAQVTVPRADADGSFSWAIIPVLDVQTSEVLFALVGRVDARSWYRGYLWLWAGPILFSLALALGVALCAILLRWYTRSQRLRHGLLGHCEALLVASFGLLFTLVIAWIVWDTESRIRWLQYRHYARMQTHEIVNTVRGLGRRIETVARLVENEPRVTKQSFERVISPYLRGSIVHCWLWVPALRHDGLPPAVAAAQTEQGASYAVWQTDECGGRIAVRRRDLYCPVVYGLPAAACAPLLGYDLCGTPVSRAALDAASSAGLPTGSEAVSLPPAGGERAILLVHSVSDLHVSGGSSVRGFVVAVLYPQTVLKQAFACFSATESPELMAEFYQLQPGAPAAFLASSAIDQYARFARMLGGGTHGTFDLCSAIPVFEFGQAYGVLVQAGPAYDRAHTLWLYKTVAVAGILLTILLAGFVGFLTHRRLALEERFSARTRELERVNQQVETILGAAADGIIGLDGGGMCTVVNVSAANLLGYDISELIGQPSQIIWHRDTDTEGAPSGAFPESPIYTTYKYGTKYRKPDGVFWRKDGTPLHVAFVSKPIYHEGLLAGAVITFRDITWQRDADRKLKDAYRKVEHINRELQEAGQVKNQFLAHMSHEIRTPLNCVIGMTGLLLNTRLDEEQKDFAETIRVSGESLLDIVNDILDYSKIEANRMELEKQPFDLRHCVEDALDLVAPAAAEKKLDLAYLIEDSVYNWWIGDATRIRQVLVNLLSNAVKFTDVGEVDLTVTGRPNDDGHHLITFSIRDTGIGIPQDRIGRLFQSFSQVDASISRRFGGTGLGLAISKRLCDLMGGEMSVESTGIPGQGATFKFTLPLMPDHSLKHVVEYAETTSMVMGKKALVGEPNTASRLTLVQQLKSLGISCVVVDSAAQALHQLRAIDLFGMAEHFDVAILDMKLTDADGLSLGAAIRNVPGRVNLPMLLLSPLGAHVDTSSGSSNVAYVTKPVKLSFLYDALVRVTSTRQATRRMAPVPRNPYDSDIGKRHPLHILLAEDNGVNQKVAQSILGKIGYRADVVSNGQEALDALRRTSYDVVLMDVQMPEMDGEQASIRVRKELPVERQPWIVAMTAHAMNGDRERYQASGMNEYIPKPIRVERLIEVLLSVQPISIQTGLEALPGG